MNHTGKSYCQRKIWQISYIVSAKYIKFGVSVNIGEENFGK